MKFGLYEPLLPPVGLPPTALMRLSQAIAVAGGADALWFPDHLINGFPRSLWKRRYNGLAPLIPNVDGFMDPVASMGYLAGKNRVSRLRLGVSVTDAGRRHPAVIAQAYATLHLLSKGRTFLGLGTGERENNVPYGVDWTAPVSRFEEAVAVIRTLWTSDGRAVNRDGAFFPLKDAIFDVPAYKGTRPPIFIAAHGPRMLKLTGRYGDGWMPAWPQTTKEYSSRLGLVRETGAQFGRNPDRIVASGWYPVITGPTSGIVDDILDSTLARSWALTFSADRWAEHGAEHPLGADFAGFQDLLPHVIDEEQALDYTRRVPEGLIRACWFAGTPADVLDQIAGYRDEGLQYPVILNIAPYCLMLKGAPAYASMLQIMRGLGRM